jgi:formate dehydrogenase gamma subunit
MAETASAYADSVHGRASRRGKETAAVCTDCHGSHAMKGPADATSSVNPQNVAATCGKCHANVQREYDRSIHGRALKAGVRDSPTCTNCHGEHHILSPKDGGSTTYAGRLAKETCGRCHGDPNLSDKYGLPADVLETYSDSYHGWAARSDSAEAATCVDCHTAHWVLPQRDRASTIHPYNVTATCRECHKDATREFAASYTHTTASVAANPVLRWVRNSYWALIALLIGGMALHNLVIVNYYLIEKRRAEKAGLTLLRLDKSQLVQHIVLAVSFIGLVVTGFALRFPESWWASGLAQLGMTESIRGVTHRVLAVVLILLSVWHVLYVLLSRRGREEFRSMLPTKRDITGFVAYMRFHLWLRDREVHFGRYDYTQKAEYWALIWGTAVMAFTGLVLWFPAHAVKWLPTWIVQVSQAIHYYEAWLATLAIAVWHFFFVLFHPKEYPMSWTWLTGRMSAESAQQHHFQWYEEETAKANQTAVAPAAPGRAPRT